MAGTTSGVTVIKNLGAIDIILYQGKTVNFEVIWGGTTPINVTGFAARLQARACVKSPDVLVEFTSANGTIVVGGSNGKFTFSMAAVASAELTPFVGVYDFEIITPSGVVYLVFSGKFEVKAEVTR